jgi:quinol monooxygenase YgiN
MVHVLVHHKVSDFNRWKESFDSHLSTRMRAGELGYRLFQSVDDPRDVTLLLDWDSAEHARQFMGSEELRDRMQQAGVVGTPDVQYIQDVQAVRRTAAD